MRASIEIVDINEENNSTIRMNYRYRKSIDMKGKAN